MNNYLRYAIVLLVLFAPSTVIAQTHPLNIVKFYDPVLKEADLSNEEFKDKYITYDFSPVWKKWSNYDYTGFIGENFQRIRIRIFSVVKDFKSPDLYYIYGKSAVGNKISPFQGTFKIKHIKRFAIMHWGIDNKYKDSGLKAQGIIIGIYSLFQKRINGSSGFFEGTFSALWYIDSNDELQYDAIENYADSFSNNQFIGTWKSYDGKKVKKCNWGDHRIPEDGDLDIGVGEFFPNKKYAKFGWQSYIDAFEKNNYKLDTFNWNQ